MFVTVGKINQSLKFEPLSNSQEPVKIVLVDLNLPMVDVVQDKLELSGADPVKTEERVGVPVLPQDVAEVLAAGREDDPVSRHLLQVSADQGHVVEILLLSQRGKCFGNIGLEIIPLQTELLGHLDGSEDEYELMIVIQSPCICLVKLVKVKI